MTAGQIAKIIMDELESILEPLLLAAGLENFNEYVVGRPKRVDDKEISIYVDSEDDNTLLHQLSFIIQCQLPSIDNETDYHDVVYAALLENIKAELVDYHYRDFVNSDVWPIDVGSNTGFLFYSIGFSNELDDCD